MKFIDVLDKKLDKNEIALGTKVGNLLSVNIDKYNSIVITGSTGTGKSVLLDEIILQMVNKYNSSELRLVLIDTVGTELNYYKDTNYSLLSAFNDINKGQEVLLKVLEEVHRRKEIIKDNNVSTIEEYNEKYNHNIPKLLVAIDDNKSFLDQPDVSNMIKNIIKQIDNLNILFVLNTNDVHNTFFERDNNLLAKVLISFDQSGIKEAENSNIPFSNDLLIGKFIVYKDDNYEEYQTLEFDDKIIEEIID
jgi:Cdc6-like AAA superfamily ATPase